MDLILCLFIRKEFQVLLETTKEKVGSGTFYLAFSINNDICLASDDLHERINIDGVLDVFRGESLNKYQFKNPLF